jgi:hypothetical protein
MYRQIIGLSLLAASANAHEMTPTYPSWSPAHVFGIVKTKLEIFNKRKDVDYFELGVFDKDWRPIPFVSRYHILRVKYLGHAKFDLYINVNDVDRAEYVCSQSKVAGDAIAAPMVASRICSRFK